MVNVEKYKNNGWGLSKKGVSTPVEKTLMIAGLAFTFIYTLTAIAAPSHISRIPSLLLAGLFVYAAYRSEWYDTRENGFRFFIASIILPVLFFMVNYAIDPVTTMEYKNVEKLAKMFLFLPIAWWLGGHLNLIFTFLWLSFIGLAITILLDPNFSQSLLSIEDGLRVSFGITSPQYTTMFFAVALIGFLSFGRRFLTAGMLTLKIVRFIVWVTLVMICLVGVIVTQTRAVWIGLLFIVLIVMFVFFINMIKNGLNRQHLFILAGSVLLVFTILSGFQSTLNKRISVENESITQILSGNFQNLPVDSSVGIRIHSWVTAMKWIKQRPLIGWGGKVSRYVLKRSPDSPLYNRKGLGHFHNSYIEITLSYGILGLAVVISLFIWANYRAWYLYKKNALPKDILVFTFLGSGLIAIINLFESYLFMRSGIHVMAIVLAPFYTLHLKYYYESSTLYQDRIDDAPIIVTN